MRGGTTLLVPRVTHMTGIAGHRMSLGRTQSAIGTHCVRPTTPHDVLCSMTSQNERRGISRPQRSSSIRSRVEPARLPGP
jgi:hypothetical protein